MFVYWQPSRYYIFPSSPNSFQMLGKQLVVQNRIYAWFKQGNHFSQWFSAVIFCTDCTITPAVLLRVMNYQHPSNKRLPSFCSDPQVECEKSISQPLESVSSVHYNFAYVLLYPGVSLALLGKNISSQKPETNINHIYLMYVTVYSHAHISDPLSLGWASLRPFCLSSAHKKQKCVALAVGKLYRLLL